MESLLSTCLNELNNRYDEIRNIPPSYQEAIAWEISYDEDYTMPWYANNYAPDLELSITSNNPSELVSVNVDKRGGWIGPWYSKDCVYHRSVRIDSTYMVAGFDGYNETVSVTISRGDYSVMSIVNMIVSGFNRIDGNRVIAKQENGGKINITPQTNDDPSLKIISNDMFD